MNEYQKSRFTAKVIEALLNTVSGKNIALFGFAFKKNTGDTRESPAIHVAKTLLDEGAMLHIYDPKVCNVRALKIRYLFNTYLQVEHSQIFDDLTHPSVTDSPEHVRKVVKIFTDPYTCTRGTHAIVVCTEWDEFVVSFLKYFLNQ